MGRWERGLLKAHFRDDSGSPPREFFHSSVRHQGLNGREEGTESPGIGCQGQGEGGHGDQEQPPWEGRCLQFGVDDRHPLTYLRFCI